MVTEALSLRSAVSLPSACKVSRALVFAALALALTATTADARRRGHHHGFSRQYILPIDPRAESYARAGFERRRFDRRSVDSNLEENGFDRRGVYRRGADRGNLLALVPPDWREQSPDPNWQGHRFVSPEGDAWVEFYGKPADAEPRDQHLRALAFIDGEELTYLQRERDWLAVSGFKGENGERIFYRKAILACDDRQWRHIAFEYPAEAKRAFDKLVTSMSKALDLSVDAYCEDATVGRGWREPR